jgi:acyl-CoA synthetase (NDP forming)/GNAT superfamily N-acetyltransferase
MSTTSTAPRADVLLADGSVAVVRPLRADDAAALHALHDGVSDEAIRLRFFAPSRVAAHKYVDQLLAAKDTLALVVEERGELVGLGTAEPIGPGVSEVSFLVADKAHGRGIGTLLVEHLAALALSNGITHFEADVLLENRAMLEVLANAGYPATRTPDGSAVVIAVGTAATAEALARADDREFAAETRSLAPLLRPRSVAVVGVRSDGTGIGATVLRSIVDGGFAGTVAAVHPRLERVLDVPAYPSVVAVPDPVDLVVVCVPARGVPAVIEDAAAAGVRAAVVLSSGFTELGAEGAELQHRLAATAREHGLRLVGPNCLGVLLNTPDVRLDATFGRSVPPTGGLAVASQSGGVGIVLADLASELGLGVHSLISLGNKADVSSNDLLAAWYDDPQVTAAALYLESFGNASKFARFARRFAERKPLLAVVGGRSQGGQRAGASHTAASASPALGVAALFAQAGVIGCDDAEDLARTALLLTEQPLPRGPRVGILSNAGGIGVLAADAAGDVGLEVPELSDALRDRLADLVQGTAGTSNPVDAGAGAGAEGMGAMLDALLGSGEIDAALVVPVDTAVTDGAAVMSALVAARVRHPDVPVVMVPLGGLTLPTVEGAPVTTYRTTTSAVRALSRAVRYAAWRAAPRTDPVQSAADLVVASQRRARELLGESSERWLTPDEAGSLLVPYGVTPLGRVATAVDDIADAARELGFPVALKVADPEVVHKTDRGLVRIGVSSEDDVRATVASFAVEMGRQPLVLVQPMVSGLEVALGVVRDPTLGPLIMVAAGGVATEVWDDRAFLVPPLTPTDATRAIGSLRMRPLLEGYRGAPSVDVDALAELVLALGRVAVDVPELSELDLNPVLVGPDGCAVVDVKVRLAPSTGPDVHLPRQLRPVPGRRT